MEWLSDKRSSALEQALSPPVHTAASPGTAAPRLPRLRSALPTRCGAEGGGAEPREPRGAPGAVPRQDGSPRGRGGAAARAGAVMDAGEQQTRVSPLINYT